MDNKQTLNALTNALDGLKETTKRNQERWHQKVWSEISIPLTLHEGLTKQTKSELDGIRKRLEIKNASSLKKAELVHLLAEKLPESIENVFSVFDQESYNVITQIIRENGLIKAPVFEQHKIDYYRSFGFIFTGTYNEKQVFVVPEEMVKQLETLVKTNEFQAMVKRNTDWIQLTHGLLYYYGALTVNDLFSLLEKYIGSPVDSRQYYSVIEHAISYYKNMRIDEHGFSNIRVFDSGRVLKEQQMRKMLNYFPLSKKQLIKAGNADFVEKNGSFINLVSHLTKNYNLPEQVAEQIAEESVYATRIGESPNAILQFLSQRLVFDSIEEIREVMDRVVGLMNNTRQWFLKGYTSNELAMQEKKALRSLPSVKKDNLIDMRTKKKIGRNDLCPCNSGKKYKKCCGK
ncbi:SEC-C metal-binding domain-containing protein [Bacillus sp. B15-48]|uniref:SEC-C metal-binding domain-containing protein n=1 Tax=Bacillus sp. B15-48 TaxID=1548601 RepID=UPI00193EDB97|nr:SEC-C metal-binding domain-containing protein [Bacillus sp. B15-48]MBM4761796.1 hypothetical protein [Bacillus sp. B15-48]